LLFIHRLPFLAARDALNGLVQQAADYSKTTDSENLLFAKRPPHPRAEGGQAEPMMGSVLMRLL
jgi:hypothetical protein